MSEAPPPRRATVPMLAATSLLRGHQTRIGHVFNIGLERTIPLKSAIAAVIGGLIGVLIGALVTGGTFSGIAYGGAFGGFGAIVFVSYSPLPGESMWAWLGLAAKTYTQRTELVDGHPTRPAIGIYHIPTVAAGSLHWRRGAVEVPAEQYDERGVCITPQRPARHSALRDSTPARPGLVRGRAKGSPAASHAFPEAQRQATAPPPAAPESSHAPLPAAVGKPVPSTASRPSPSESPAVTPSPLPTAAPSHLPAPKRTRPVPPPSTETPRPRHLPKSK